MAGAGDDVTEMPQSESGNQVLKNLFAMQRFPTDPANRITANTIPILATGVDVPCTFPDFVGDRSRMQW